MHAVEPSSAKASQSAAWRFMRAVSRAFFAIGIAGIGLQQTMLGNFVPVILPSFPAWLPVRAAWVAAIGFFLILSGVAILVPRTARTAAVFLGTVLLAFLVFRHIPDQLSAAPRVLGAWTNAFKLLTLAGGAFVVAGTTSVAKPGFISRCFMIFGSFALGFTCILFGLDHFIYTRFVAQLVPDWIPGHNFWAYFCGVALIAAGVGLIARLLPRLAAGLLGGMIFAWLIVLHIPRAITDPHSGHGNEITSVFEALAFAGIAFLLALAHRPGRTENP